ncbi:MAG TPA: hypothetical protein VGG71_10905, partial [Chitinophagaceae bacterium]
MQSDSRLKMCAKIFFITFLVLYSLGTKAQDTADISKKPTFFSYDSLHQTDITDVARRVFKKNLPINDTAINEISKPHLTVLPAVGYSLQTGFAALLSANITFPAKEGQNLSTMVTSVTYTQYRQFIVPLQTNIWFKNGKYNFQSDWRFLKYHSFTYGFGTHSIMDDGYRIDYYYFRIHQNVSRKISRKFYAGLGIDADLYWNIREIDPAPGVKTDFETYGLYKSETAVGPTINLLYDSRGNSINPENGSYLNISYRPKLKFMGSDATWQSLILEYRGYKKFPANSGNTIAIWSYNWFTFGGKPPYLLLPSTGWDANVNTGRGYIQSRFRGNDMLYLESEYRFLITSNGLFGGVVFANAQTFSNRESTLSANASLKDLDSVQPGYGVGIRIKVNKFSRANLCIDYGW